MQKKQIITYITLVVVVSGTLVAFNDPFVYNKTMFVLGIDIPYIPSNITQANHNIVAIDGGGATFKAEFVSDIKNSVDSTVHGTVLSVSTPLPWTDSVGNERGIVSVELQIIEATKGQVTNSNTFIVHLLTDKLDGTFYLDSYEPEFEIGEEVIVHTGIETPDATSGDLNLVVLGEYGKYQVQGDRAYNIQFPYGKSINDAKNEAR